MKSLLSCLDKVLLVTWEGNTPVVWFVPYLMDS